MEDYAIKFEHVSKIYKLKKKNDGKHCVCMNYYSE